MFSSFLVFHLSRFLMRLERALRTASYAPNSRKLSVSVQFPGGCRTGFGRHAVPAEITNANRILAMKPLGQLRLDFKVMRSR